MNTLTPQAANPALSATIAHDYLLVMRGAERTFAAIADTFPGADIHTLVYDPELTGQRFPGRRIRGSVLQRLGTTQRSFRALLPLYPRAAERMRIPESDVFISSSSAFAHGMRTLPGTLHICYSHTPFRYAWYERERALREVGAPLRALLDRQLATIRAWDLSASRRVDHFIANSMITRERIRRYYGRDAAILHPPVETDRFRPGSPGERLLVVSELVRHKRVHVALEAARRARTPIAVAGSGPQEDELRAEFPEAHMLGRVSDAELTEHYSRARAVIVPSIEEFGIVAVEAQAAGRPVIAAGAGGALETVLDGETGMLVKPDDVGSFQRAIQSIDQLGFRTEQARRNAQRFSVAAFRTGLIDNVQRALAADRVSHLAA